MFSPEVLDRPNERQRILALLETRQHKGVYVYELIAPRPGGLGISQYGRAIKQLRDEGIEVVNTRPGHFVLGKYKTEFNEVKIEEVEKRLAVLRNRWRTEPDNHKAIELQAKPLLSMLESMKLDSKEKEEAEETEKAVTETMF